MSLFYSIYAFLFARPVFFKFNKFLFNLSIRGMGILNYKNSFLSGEHGFLKDYLSNIKAPLVLDIGANCGDYSNDVIKINSNSTIYAFEPHPVTFEKLKDNVQFEYFNPYNFGVGESDGELKLFDYVDNDGSSHASLFKGVIEDIHKKSAVAHNVKVIQLDNFIKENNIEKIDLLKIDTEGNEYNALLGLKENISNKVIKVIHFEFNEMNVISSTFFKNIWDILPNYKFYRLLPGGAMLKIKNYTPLSCEIFAYQNVVAILN